MEKTTHTHTPPAKKKRREKAKVKGAEQKKSLLCATHLQIERKAEKEEMKGGNKEEKERDERGGRGSSQLSTE